MPASSILMRWVWVAVCVCLGASARAVEPPPPSAIAELLEDDAAGLLAKLTNPTGDPGQGFVEERDVFSGRAAVRIVPMQRFEPKIAGWGYRIVERPRAGEFRYLRFAWRADAGAQGIMVQFHDETDWRVRLTAGQDVYHWGTRFVAAAPPEKWAVVTCDLYKDFGGAERTIQGIALTVFGGTGGRFDHIYLARSVDDLDRIDATGPRGGAPAKLDDAALDALWRDLSDEDAAVAYRAFWALANAPEQAAEFVGRQLAWGTSSEAAKQLRGWIRDLDAGDFRVRESATRALADHLEAATPLLRAELGTTTSEEARRRIGQLLARVREEPGRGGRVEKGVRVLRYADTPAARAWLETFAKGDAGTALAAAARAALER